MEANYDESINKTTDSIEDPKWMKLFPKCVTDFNGSATFMTRAIFVTFSVILRRRGILPSDYFGRSYITEKMSCTTLDFKNPEAYAISHKLKACGGAITKGYLKELSLVLTEKEGQEDAFEVYCFQFRYYEDGRVSASLNTRANGEVMKSCDKLTELEYKGSQSVRDQLILLVRSVMFITQRILKPLPETFAVNFRVNYTDNAPDVFKIDGFDDTSNFYTLPAGIQSASLGHVRPGYHGGFLECSSVFIDDAYEVESKIKAHLEKFSNELGYDADTTYNQEVASESIANNLSQTSSEILARMSDRLSFATQTPKKVSPEIAEQSPKPTRTTRKSKKVVEEEKKRSSPYRNLRSRK